MRSRAGSLWATFLLFSLKCGVLVSGGDACAYMAALGPKQHCFLCTVKFNTFEPRRYARRETSFTRPRPRVRAADSGVRSLPFVTAFSHSAEPSHAPDTGFTFMGLFSAFGSPAPGWPSPPRPGPKSKPVQPAQGRVSRLARPSRHPGLANLRPAREPSPAGCAILRASVAFTARLRRRLSGPREESRDVPSPLHSLVSLERPASPHVADAPEMRSLRKHPLPTPSARMPSRASILCHAPAPAVRVRVCALQPLLP